MDVVAYATESYAYNFKDTWNPSVAAVATTVHLKIDPENVSYTECIKRKIQNLVEHVPSKDCEYVLSSDLDIVFFKNERHWKRLFEYMKKSTAQIFFMRDAVQSNVNMGLFFVKRDYFEGFFKEFISNSTFEPPHYEQDYVNANRRVLEWDFIPEEFSYVTTRPFGTDMSRVLFYHAICVQNKVSALNFAIKAKKYQVYLCFHPEVAEETQCVLYKHPWLVPYRLNSTKYYEAECILGINPDPECTYTGLVTYSILKKPHIFRMNILKELEFASSSGAADVVTLNYHPHHRFEHVVNDHTPKFLRIWDRLVAKLFPFGDSEDSEMEMFYNNYWVARPSIMSEYQWFLRRAVELLEDDPEVYDDACYVSGKLSPEKLVEISGKPHYTYHPFILERLPCLFFWRNRKRFTVYHHLKKVHIN